MKRMFVCVLSLAAVVLLVAAPASAGQQPVVVINALEFDELGNALSGSNLTLNGRALGIGDRMQAGILRNDGSRPVVVALSNGRLLQIEPGEAMLLDAALQPERKCVCYCGGEVFGPLPGTTEAACQAHNGERCLMREGNYSFLRDCALTWVQTDPAAPTGPQAQ